MSEAVDRILEHLGPEKRCPVCAAMERLRQQGGLNIISSSSGYNGWLVGVRSSSKPRPRWTQRRETLAEAAADALDLVAAEQTDA